MLLAAAAVFIGSQACRPCHADIADAYARTPMARSSGPVVSVPDATFAAAGHAYRIRQNKLQFTAAGRDLAVSIDYFIGSTAAGRSFLTSRDRYLFEIPVTW